MEAARQLGCGQVQDGHVETDQHGRQGEGSQARPLAPARPQRGSVRHSGSFGCQGSFEAVEQSRYCRGQSIGGHLVEAEPQRYEAFLVETHRLMAAVVEIDVPMVGVGAPAALVAGNGQLTEVSERTHGKAGLLLQFPSCRLVGRLVRRAVTGGDGETEGMGGPFAHRAWIPSSCITPLRCEHMGTTGPWNPAEARDSTGPTGSRNHGRRAGGGRLPAFESRRENYALT